jgi:hypothetical protein
MLAFAALGALRLLLLGHAREPERGGSDLRRAAVPAAMLGAVALIPALGFGLAGAAMALALAAVSQHGRPSASGFAAAAGAAVAVVLAFTWSFRALLAVPLPAGPW